jgi:hypothetical protein
MISPQGTAGSAREVPFWTKDAPSGKSASPIHNRMVVECNPTSGPELHAVVTPPVASGGILGFPGWSCIVSTRVNEGGPRVKTHAAPVKPLGPSIIAALPSDEMATPYPLTAPPGPRGPLGAGHAALK